MNNHQKKWLEQVFWGFIGLSLLYFVGNLLATEHQLRQSNQPFHQVEHPQGTSLVDTLKLQFSSYPATYADHSIHFRSATLIGELRSYHGDWQIVQDFYNSRALDNSDPIALIPLEVRRSEENVRLDIPDWFLISPSHPDILDGIREQYDFWGWPTSLKGTTKGLYLVYALIQ